MPTDRQQSKQATRERIAQVATTLFLDRGFDEVTVNEVAAQAGVSKVTVFAHFPQKEDLLIDRGPEAKALLADAIRRRPAGTDQVAAVRRLAARLARERHPLSGLNPTSRPLLATIAGSAALLNRARELGTEIEVALAAELTRDGRSPDAAELLAALLIAAYRTVLTETARRVLAGERESRVAARHRRSLTAAFDAVQAGADALAQT